MKSPVIHAGDSSNKLLSQKKTCMKSLDVGETITVWASLMKSVLFVLRIVYQYNTLLK